MSVRVNRGESQTNRPTPDGPGGFKESKLLEGNIGYVDLRGFFPASATAAMADEHMKRLADADAVIIDL